MKAFPLLLLIALMAVFIIPAVRASRSQNSSPYQPYQSGRLLCKSRSNRVIAGVCGGIADHYGWNAAIVRLFFILSGIGLLTYAVLAIVIPDPPSPLL